MQRVQQQTRHTHCPVQDKRLAMDELAMRPEALAEMISLIESGTISGKIGKEILPALLQGEGERSRRSSGIRVAVGS